MFVVFLTGAAGGICLSYTHTEDGEVHPGEVVERPLELWVKKQTGMKTTTTWWSVAARTTRITGWLLIFQPTTIETD